MSLWRTADGQDWVLIPIAEHERACVVHTLSAMQHTLAASLGDDVALGVRTGKLMVYVQGVNAADHRLASAAVLRAQALLARHYDLADASDGRGLAAALADDFAARYGEALASVTVPDAV